MTRELLTLHRDAPSERIKVLLASMPLDEHVLPMTGLAVALRDAGYDVRWYTQEIYASQLADLDIPHFPFKRPPQFHSGNLSTVFPARADMRSERQLMRHDLKELFIRRGPEYYEDLKEIHLQFPFAVVVADLGFTAIPFITRLLQVPVISIGLHPLKESSVCLPPYGQGQSPALKGIAKLAASWKRFSYINLTYRGLVKLQHKLHHQYGIRATGHVHDDMISHSSLVLQSGTPGFEYTRKDMSDHIRFCGPVLAHRSPREKYWMGHHGTYEHTILVTQDKFDTDPDALLVPVLEAYCNSNARVIAITNGQHTQNLRKRFACSNVIIEDDINYDDVMPYADVFVGQGNHQEVMHCIRQKLPVVVVGGRGCRKEVGARVAYFKLGVHLKSERPAPDILKRGIDEVLKNPLYREQVTALSAEFSRYDPAGMIVRFVQAFARGYRLAGSNLKVRPIDFTDL